MLEKKKDPMRRVTERKRLIEIKDGWLRVPRTLGETLYARLYAALLPSSPLLCELIPVRSELCR